MQRFVLPLLLLVCLGSCEFFPTDVMEHPEYVALEAELTSTRETMLNMEDKVANAYQSKLDAIEEIERLTETVRAGDLSAQSAADAAAAIGVAIAEANQAGEEYEAIKSDLEALQASYGNVQGRMEKIAQDTGTPWWQMLLGAAGVFLTGGSLPTMNRIPILGALSGKTSSKALELLKLRSEAERVNDRVNGASKI